MTSVASTITVRLHSVAYQHYSAKTVQSYTDNLMVFKVSR